MYQLISKFQKVVNTDRIQFRHRKYEIPWFATVWITHYIKWNKTSIKEYFFLKILNFKIIFIEYKFDYPISSKPPNL